MHEDPAMPSATPLTGPTFLWPAALAVSAFLGSWAFACVFPFVALAVIVAATMPLRAAAATMGALWLLNQIVGFTLLSYPHTLDSYAWGLAIGGATLAAMVVARAVVGDRPLVSLRTVTAFLVAFATYELLLYAVALFAGGLETFSAAIVADIFRNDAMWFAGLVALHLVLTRAAPRRFGPAPVLRVA